MITREPDIPANRPVDARWHQTEEDGRWMAEHDQELFDRYRGSWVAVWRKQVIGTGRTAVEASEQAERVAPVGEFVLEYYYDGPDDLHGFV